MTAKRAVELMQIEKECISRACACDRDCGKCDLVQEDTELLAAFDMAIQALGWIPVSVALPELPDRDWASVMVIARYESCGQQRVTPMIYERAVVRGKRVERWKWHWDRIVDVTVTDWKPLPMA